MKTIIDNHYKSIYGPTITSMSLFFGGIDAPVFNYWRTWVSRLGWTPSLMPFRFKWKTNMF